MPPARTRQPVDADRRVAIAAQRRSTRRRPVDRGHRRRHADRAVAAFVARGRAGRATEGERGDRRPRRRRRHRRNGGARRARCGRGRRIGRRPTHRRADGVGETRRHEVRADGARPRAGFDHVHRRRAGRGARQRPRLRRRQRAARRGGGRLQRGDVRGLLGREQALRRLRCAAGRVRVQPALVDREERAERVVVALRNRVGLVVVAARTADGQPEEGRTQGVDAVGDRFVAPLRLDRAAFVGHPVQPPERRRRARLLVGIGQQVAGHKFVDEARPRAVLVQRLQQPVAPRPRAALEVRLVAEGVGEAREVEPRRREVFGGGVSGQQFVDAPFVGVGPCVGDVAGDFGGRRRQAGQRQVDAAQLHKRRGRRRRPAANGGERLLHVAVERIARRPPGIAECRRGRCARRREGPVLGGRGCGERGNRSGGDGEATAAR